jgi:hypothetical protein
MKIVLAPWGYTNEPPICDISQALVIKIIGPVCHVTTVSALRRIGPWYSVDSHAKMRTIGNVGKSL